MTNNGTQIQVRCLTQETQIRACLQDWNALVDKFSLNAVFFRPEWFLAVHQWHQGECTPYILAVYHNSELIAVLPLMRCISIRPLFRYAMLGFMMMPSSPYHDIICEDAHTDSAMAAITEFLIHHQSEWNEIDLRHIQLNGKLSRFLQKYHYTLPFKIITGESEFDSMIIPGYEWQSYLKLRSRNLRRNIQNITNRLHKMGEISITHFKPTTFDHQAAEKIASDISLIASNSWKSGNLHDLSRMQAQSYLKSLFADDRLNSSTVIWLLKLDKRPIAYEIQLIEDQHIYALHADFDNSFQRMSPGSYLNSRIIKDFFNSSMAAYHMGVGGHHYKLKWQNDSQNMLHYRLYNPSLRSKVARFFYCLTRHF